MPRFDDSTGWGEPGAEWEGGEVFPTTGDSGVTYGNDILSILKYGVGAYVGLESQKNYLENKTLYEASPSGLTENGQRSNYYPGASPRTAIPSWVWLAAAAIGVVLLVRQ